MSLEFGVINKFSVQIPWTTIHTGLVHIFVDSISIVLRLNVLEHDSQNDGQDSIGNESFAHDIKMVGLVLDLSIFVSLTLNLYLSCNLSFPPLSTHQNKLAMEELKLLGHDDAAASQSWVSKYMGSVASSMLAKIAAKFSLTASK